MPDNQRTSTHSVLVVGDPRPLQLIDELAHRTPTIVVALPAAASMQHNTRFDVVALIDDAADTDPAVRRAALHCAVQHLEPHGQLIVMHAPDFRLADFGLRASDFLVERVQDLQASFVSVFRRGPRITVHDLVYEARALIRRVTPHQLAHQLATAAAPLIVDTRAHIDRARFGIIADSVHVPRTVLEWQLDPANGYLHPAVVSFDQALVIVCNSGYSSSLAAANLIRLGYVDVADLIGGHMAWRAAGLPVVSADHSHVEPLGAFERPE